MMSKIKITYCVFLMVLLIMVNPFHSYSQDKSSDVISDDDKKETTELTPQLADIIPLSAKLAENLATLEEEIKSIADISQIEGDYNALEKRLETPEVKLKQLVKAKDYSSSDLLEFKKTLDTYNKTFEDINDPLKDAIATLGNWRAEWQKEKTQWTYGTPNISKRMISINST